MKKKKRYKTKTNDQRTNEKNYKKMVWEIIK